jgi:Protein of unknown function (DUF3224)
MQISKLAHTKILHWLQLTFAFCLVLALPFCAQSQAAQQTPTQEPTMIRHATGTFEVKISPLTLENKSAPETLGRYSVNKQIHGDLEATSIAEMLAAKTATPGSQAYVAIEYVTGTLKGHKGSFVLQHRGVMSHGNFELLVTVVPDSGTGELTGLAGTFKIIITDGKHSYDFEYTLPDAAK